MTLSPGSPSVERVHYRGPCECYRLPCSGRLGECLACIRARHACRRGETIVCPDERRARMTPARPEKERRR